MALFHYDNTETKHKRGKRTVRRVFIRGGTGYKSVAQFVGGKRRGSIKHNLRSEEIAQIRKGTFIPGLFRDCKVCSHAMKRTRKMR